MLPVPIPRLKRLPVSCPVVAATRDAQGLAALREGVDRLVQVIAPMMPHLAETCWTALGHEGLVADAPWPAVDPALLVEDSVTVAVQVNGKLRGTVELPRDAPANDIEQAALALPQVARTLEGRTPKKIVVVPNRIVNVVA